MYCAPSHSSNTEKQYAWARIRAGGRPQRAVPTEEKKKRPLRKAAAILRRHRLKPELPNPKTGETRKSSDAGSGVVAVPTKPSTLPLASVKKPTIWPLSLSPLMTVPPGPTACGSSTCW